MLKLFSFEGSLSPPVYVPIAPMLLLSQNLMVALCFHLGGVALEADAWFWLLPLRRLAQMPGLTATQAAFVFAFAFVVAWLLAALSFRRATWSGSGRRLSAFAIFPAIQIIVVAVLTVWPRRSAEIQPVPDDRVNLAYIMEGVLAGVAILVAAVLLSALTLGAYGWGLFIATPFVAGMTTGFIVNRRAPQSAARTMSRTCWQQERLAAWLCSCWRSKASCAYFWSLRWDWLRQRWVGHSVERSPWSDKVAASR